MLFDIIGEIPGAGGVKEMKPDWMTEAQEYFSSKEMLKKQKEQAKAFDKMWKGVKGVIKVIENAKTTVEKGGGGYRGGPEKKKLTQKERDAGMEDAMTRLVNIPGTSKRVEIKVVQGPSGGHSRQLVPTGN